MAVLYDFYKLGRSMGMTPAEALAYAKWEPFEIDETDDVIGIAEIEEDDRCLKYFSN